MGPDMARDHPDNPPGPGQAGCLLQDQEGGCGGALDPWAVPTALPSYLGGSVQRGNRDSWPATRAGSRRARGCGILH